MNREIKFRVYTEIKPEVLGMKYFDLSDTSERNDTVMQFTGLLDKHGKEIYEGDILANSSSDLPGIEVKWSDYLGAFTTTTGVLISEIKRGFVDGIDGVTYYNDSEIIGNISENPELIN